MRLYEDRAKVLGIIVCAILGLTLLCLDLLFSHHDDTTINRSELVEFNNDWVVAFQNKEYDHVIFPTKMEASNSLRRTMQGVSRRPYLTRCLYHRI